MPAFLTSSPGGQYKVEGKRLPCKLSCDNGFLEKLQNHWRADSRVLIVSSDPDDYDVNDSIKNIFQRSFPMSGLSVSCMNVWDNRVDTAHMRELSDYDAVILAGGHVPTQNAFFCKIQLEKTISDYEGILIGISAGTMNCADLVYAQPELEGEAVNPDYQRFLPGLGITKLTILPHYQDVKNDSVDGLRVIEDITFPDSEGKEFLCLCDGSYVWMDGRKSILYGEGYKISNGKIKQICEQDKHISLD